MQKSQQDNYTPDATNILPSTTKQPLRSQRVRNDTPGNPIEPVLVELASIKFCMKLKAMQLSSAALI
jgi:hypothetical protein